MKLLKYPTEIQNAPAVHPQTEAIPALEIHPSVSPKAAELLLKVSKALMVAPQTYDQDEPWSKLHGSDFSHCGSACCIVGHMRAFAGVNTAGNSPGLGLTDRQFSRIFNHSFWPCWAYGASTPTAQEGIARIEHFLRTGE